MTASPLEASSLRHEPVTLVPAQAGSGRVARPGEPQVVAMEGEIDVLREPADQAEGIGERGPSLEDHPWLTFERHHVLERPADPEVLLHDECVAEAQPGGGFGEQVAPFGGTPSGHLLHVASYCFPDNSAMTGRIQSGAASACRPRARR